MLAFCAKLGITADPELIAIDKVKYVWERIDNNDV